MKWFCEECGEYFDEPEKERENHSELAGMGGITYEEFDVCPVCRSQSIVECERCEACGEEVPETEVFGHTYMCDSCRGKVEDKLIELRDYVQAEFDINDYKEAEEIILEIADNLF